MGINTNKKISFHTILEILIHDPVVRTETNDAFWFVGLNAFLLHWRRRGRNNPNMFTERVPVSLALITSRLAFTYIAYVYITN